MIRFLLLALLSSTFTFFTISWLASEFPYDLNRLLATLTHTCNVIIITNIVEPTKLETISLRGKLIFAITHSGAAVCWRLSGQWEIAISQFLHYINNRIKIKKMKRERREDLKTTTTRTKKQQEEERREKMKREAKSSSYK